MEFCILMGSPRKAGHTKQMLDYFTEELELAGHSTEVVWLYDKKILPCVACRVCQDVMDGFGCAQTDDMAELAAKIQRADCFVLATPIYSWYCTAPMKAMLDRLVYGMNKYYGKQKGSLWKKKPCALLLTGGYPEEESASLFEKGMEGYCRHSRLAYQGSVFLRDFGYQSEFYTPEKERQTRDFAKRLIQALA